jgi:hypothetical protein
MKSGHTQSFNRTIIPLAGIPVFIILYIIAAAFYPGGHPGDVHAAGFSWLHNYWCNLLNEQAINGEPNKGRPVAFAGMIVLCVSLAAFWFYYPVKQIITVRIQWLIRISGVLAMLAALFITVFDHDAVTNIASLLGLIAVTGTLVILYKTKQSGLFRYGLLNLLLVGVNNLFYYTPSLLHYLPLVQKISFASVLCWIWLIAYRDRKPD